MNVSDRARERRPSAPASMSSTAPPLNDDPRRRQVHDRRRRGRVRADEAELPVGRCGRPPKTTDGRLGPVRRLHARPCPPRQELAVGERRRCRPICSATGRAGRNVEMASVVRNTQHIGAVGQHHERDRPGPARPVEHVGQQHAGVGGAGVADRRGQVVGHRPSRAEPAWPLRAPPAAWVPVTTAIVDLLGAQLRRLQRGFHAWSASGR